MYSPQNKGIKIVKRSHENIVGVPLLLGNKQDDFFAIDYQYVNFGQLEVTSSVRNAFTKINHKI